MLFFGLIFATTVILKKDKVVDNVEPETRVDKQLIGGDKDEGGCLIGAGYRWCEPKQKCLREWEEPCEDNK